jgi:hypothetical protein
MSGKQSLFPTLYTAKIVETEKKNSEDENMKTQNS